MPEILKNPGIEDYFLDIELTEAQRDSKSFLDQYEDCNLINLKGFRLNVDFDFLNEISYDVDVDEQVLKIFKKYPVSKILGVSEESLKNGSERPFLTSAAGAFLRRYSRPILEHFDKGSVVRAERLLFEKVFESNADKFKYFQTQVRSGHLQILELFRSLFPSYRVYNIAASWRFNETKFENLHWDNFKELEDFHQVRIFINLDQCPRIWHTSHRLEAYVSQVYASENLAEKTGSLHPNQFTSYINSKLLGGMKNRCFDGLPRHVIAFNQGDVWLTETRIVSHQIFFGRRAIAYMFYIDPTTMLDPERRFNQRVQCLHAGAAVAAKQARPPADF